MLDAHAMRQMLLFLLSLLLASGTIAGSIAHATEDCGPSAPLAASEAHRDGCVETVAKATKDSPAGDQSLPSMFHGCHGHHSGVPADLADAPAETDRREQHAPAPAIAMVPATFTGTFRPPIA